MIQQPQSPVTGQSSSLKAVHFVVGLAALAVVGTIGVVVLSWGEKKVTTPSREPALVDGPRAVVHNPADVAHLPVAELAGRVRTSVPGVANAKYVEVPGYSQSWKDINGQHPGLWSILLMDTTVGVYFYVPKGSLEQPDVRADASGDLAAVANVLANLSGDAASVPAVQAVQDQLVSKVRAAIGGRSIEEDTPPIDLGTISINGLDWKVGSISLQDRWAKERPEKSWLKGLCGLTATLSPKASGQE